MLKLRNNVHPLHFLTRTMAVCASLKYLGKEWVKIWDAWIIFQMHVNGLNSNNGSIATPWSWFSYTTWAFPIEHQTVNDQAKVELHNWIHHTPTFLICNTKPSILLGVWQSCHHIHAITSIVDIQCPWLVINACTIPPFNFNLVHVLVKWVWID
jgi:hypothetical protein